MTNLSSAVRVHVTLLSRFVAHSSALDPEGCLLVPHGTTVLELADLLGILRKFVIIFLINGRQGCKSDILHNGDTVVLVPPAVGGG